MLFISFELQVFIHFKLSRKMLLYHVNEYYNEIIAFLKYAMH